MARGMTVVGALALTLLLGSIGCRPPRPAPPVPAADSLMAMLAAPSGAAPLEGSGPLRLKLPGRSLPVVTARFVVSPDSARATLRPGALAPVLSLWCAADGWQLMLPRQRAVVAGSAAGPDRIDVARLFWYLLRPRALALDLTAPEALASGGRWILRGRVDALGAWARGAEIEIDPATRAVVRWSIGLASGESALRVAYDPPVLEARAGTGIGFVVPALGGRGDLTLSRIRRSSAQPVPRPSIPPGWEVLTTEDVPRLLEALSKPAE
jgi:hypothetical protein